MNQTAPGAQRAEDWAGALGAKWLSGIDRFESMLAPAGAALLARAGLSPGERVVDIGCGGGLTTLAIAEAVGPSGEAVGLDISAELIDLAQRRGAAAGAPSVRFICADAGEAQPEGAPFDRMFSRFGSMFFPDAKAGFRNLHRMLKPGGRLDLCAWAPAADNPWLAQMGAIVRAHLDMPAPTPGAPGGFAFADPDYMREVLAAGGFREPDIAAWSDLQYVGGAGLTPSEATDFAIGSMAFADRLAERPEVLARVRGELEALFARHYIAGQGVGMPAKAWLVRATA